MKNKYVDNVKPYKPEDRMSFKEIDLFLDWNESLIWKGLTLAPHLNPKALNRYPELNNSNEISLLGKYVKHKCSIDLYPGSDIALNTSFKSNSSLLLLDHRLF